MNSNWTEYEIALLKQYYPTLERPREITSMINKSYSAIRTKAAKIGIHRQFHTGPWTLEKETRLRQLYAFTRNADIAKILQVSEMSIIARAFRLKLRKDPKFMLECSSVSCYKKGRTPENKGKPMCTWMSKEGLLNSSKTRFSKGTIPPNYKPVGSERLSKDGYYEIKTKDPRTWEFKHRVVWVEHHGAIPQDHIVKFKDGNKLNLSIDNLYLSDRVQNMKDNTNHNYPEPIANAIQLRGALNRQINKHLKKLLK